MAENALLLSKICENCWALGARTPICHRRQGLYLQNYNLWGQFL